MIKKTFLRLVSEINDKPSILTNCFEAQGRGHPMKFSSTLREQAGLIIGLPLPRASGLEVAGFRPTDSVRLLSSSFTVLSTTNS
jgi:hypothetical protein